MITGGTGSLGNALVEKLLEGENEFSKIVIYSRDEHKQSRMAQKFSSNPRASKLRFLIGDTRDISRFDLACRGVSDVIHAAALKIVPVAEYNPFEAVKTNILGSQNLIEIAHKSSTIRRVIGVSTDKACSPTNLYGATKLTMEKLILAANEFNRLAGPKFSIVRYGNVSGSNGSVIPLFLRQGLNFQPLTVTHRLMTRFWITLEDARDFVLKCLEIMDGDEIFIPEMPSYKVIDLANILSRNICYTGIRPGEKIHEEIISEHELMYTWSHANYFVVNKHINPDYLEFLETFNLPTRSFTSETQNIKAEDLEMLLYLNKFINKVDYAKAAAQ